MRELLRKALVFAPDRLGLYNGAAGLLVALDVVDPARAALGGGARTAARRARGRARESAPPFDFARPPATI